MKLEMMKKIIIITVLVLISLIATSGFHGKRQHRSIDRPVMIEEWMTQPFIDSIDEDLMVEDWMTKPFITFNS